ncbi:hypothetical protein G7068_10460 [Leucobacter viscericola]|uniref:HTH luxR-type domain-containing protein n=1 Tax=Leucobacter viscericola TaxID=2714935 RepID=A0A6G7XGD9_9MICO|nr:LuxR family transcriptional regulator [Leucobacter viscericola]QIK63572.1 hypothetical protein G7068_10460 [Leucobacter viscericola]
MFIFEEASERAFAAIRAGQHVRVVGRRLSGRSSVLRELVSALESSGIPVIAASGGTIANGQVGYTIDQVAASLNLELDARNAFATVDSLSQALSPGTVIALDNVHNMDALSLQVLSAVRERIGLRFATTELPGKSRIADLPPVWPETLIWVPDLDLTSSALLAHHTLDGPVDTRLLSLVYSKSGGNTGLIVALLESARDTGLLELRNEVWVSRTGHLWNANLTSLLDGLLYDLSEEELGLVTWLAKEGPVPVSVVLQEHTEKTLHRLFEQRFVARVGDEESGLIQVWPLILSARFQQADTFSVPRPLSHGEVFAGLTAHRTHAFSLPLEGGDLAYIARGFASHEETTIQQSFLTWQANPTTENALNYLNVALGFDEERLNILSVFDASLKDSAISDRNDAVLYYRYVQWLLLVEHDRDQARALVEALFVRSPQWGPVISDIFNFLQALHGAPARAASPKQIGDSDDVLRHDARLGTALIHGDVSAIREGLEAVKGRLSLNYVRSYIEPALLFLDGSVRTSIDTAIAHRKEALARFDRVSYLTLSYTMALGAQYLGDDQLMSTSLSEASIIGRPGIVFSSIHGAIFALKAIESHQHGHHAHRDDLLREAKTVAPAVGPFFGMGTDFLTAFFELEDQPEDFDRAMAELTMRHVKMGYHVGAIQVAVAALIAQWGSRTVTALGKAFDAAPLNSYARIVHAANLLEEGDAQAATDWAHTLPEYAEEWHLIGQLWSSAVRSAAHDGREHDAKSLVEGFPRPLDSQDTDSHDTARESLERLSKREREIGLLAGELSNPEIAERLSISRRTVENHISSALKKTVSSDRAELSLRLKSFSL